jgi:hypothetical protein
VLGLGYVVSVQGVKDFTKVRVKTDRKFYSLSKGGMEPAITGSMSPVG